MSTVGMLSLTLKDYHKRLGPKHEIAPIVEIMDETNEVNQDAMYLEANNINTHRTVIRTGFPESYWRTLNRGVPKGKSTTKQVDDIIGMLENWSVVDAALADLNGTTREFMLSEEYAFLESMNQEVARTIFYGDLAKHPDRFQGLSARFCTRDHQVAPNAENVLSLGGTGNNCTSIWLLTWGDQTLHMIYPKGSTVGLKREALGRVPVSDDDGNEYMGYKTHYAWHLGLVVRNWKYCVRVCNLDLSTLSTLIDGGAAAAAQQKLVRVMIDAANHIPAANRGRMAWYMNRDVKTMLDIIAAEKSNVNLTIEKFEGRPVTTFKGIPIRQVDALGAEEALPNP